MNEHPIEGLMETTLDKIKQMVDVNTVIGNPITTADGTTIIPVSKVTYGFASGGSEFATKKLESNTLFGGGSGAGVTINPIAFIAVSNGEAKLLNIENFQDSQDRAVAMVPELIDKIVGLFKKDKKDEDKKEEIDDPTV